MEHILLIDDEQHILDVVEYVLKENGFSLATALDGDTALRLFKNDLPDLVVLDLNLPGLSGLELFQEMKHHDPGVPVIMLTSRSKEVDRVLGLEMGADDYVTKPFSPRELAARVRAVLRRTRKGSSAAGSGLIRHGPLEINPQGYMLKYYGRQILLTRQEFRLLKALVRYPARVFTRDNLIQRIYDGDTYVTDRSIDACVKRIRRKLEEVQPGIDPICTVYGVGYKFNETISLLGRRIK
jgi:DNA-binding response OmpR family regulator